MKSEHVNVFLVILILAVVFISIGINQGWIKWGAKQSGTAGTGRMSVSSTDTTITTDTTAVTDDKPHCAYTDKDGKTITLYGEKGDTNFIKKCEQLKGHEPHYFTGYTQPYYPSYYYYPSYGYYSYPQYYYQSYYPSWYSGWGNRRWWR